MSTENTTPDWSKVELSDEYSYIDGVSAQGKPFKVRVSKADDQPAATANDVDESRINEAEGWFDTAGKSNFDIKVDWPGSRPPPGFSNDHKPTAEETKITSITGWRLNTAPLSYNEFTFTCTENYKFKFHDATGDIYTCNVIWPRSLTSHGFFFFSSQPKIVRIEGS